MYLQNNVRVQYIVSGKLYTITVIIIRTNLKNIRPLLHRKEMNIDEKWYRQAFIERLTLPFEKFFIFSNLYSNKRNALNSFDQTKEQHYPDTPI